MADEQTVAPPDAETTSQTEDTSARKDDLDSILNEWVDQEVPETKPQNIGERIEARLNAMEQQLTEKQARTDLDMAVNKVVEHLEGGDPEMVKTFILGMADQDQRFVSAWQQRSANPKGWDAILKATADKMSGWVPKSDPSVTEEIVAAKAAVRGTSISAPESDAFPSKEQWDKMTDTEYQQKLTELGMG